MTETLELASRGLNNNILQPIKRLYSQGFPVIKGVSEKMRELLGHFAILILSENPLFVFYKNLAQRVSSYSLKLKIIL